MVIDGIKYVKNTDKTGIYTCASFAKKSDSTV